MSRFSVIPATAVVDARLTLRELSVLAAIGIHTDRNGWCYPSSERIGEMLGIQGAMVRKSIAALAKAGYVQIVARRREDGGQTSNAIRVLMDTEHGAERMRCRLSTASTAPPPVPPEGTPPVPPEGTPPVPPEGTPPVPPEGTRKPPLELSPTETSSPSGKRASRLPADWMPTQPLITAANSRGLWGAQLDDEVEKFRNYWHAKAGKDAAKLDWDATFRSWIINATKYAKPQGATHGTPNPGNSRPSLAARVAEHERRIFAAHGLDADGRPVHGTPMAQDDGAVRAPLDGTARRIP